MSDAELIEKVLMLKGWQNVSNQAQGNVWFPPNPYLVQMVPQPPPNILTSRDACWDVFERDAHVEYWKCLARHVYQGSIEWFEAIAMCKATPKQRCETFVAFMTGKKE